jgi:hypothetical protein
VPYGGSRTKFMVGKYVTNTKPVFKSISYKVKEVKELKELESHITK